MSRGGEYNGMSDGFSKTPDEINPEEAFQLFSHELRLEILFALWNAPEYSLTFSDIRAAVGEPDSGKFTYHLEKVTDHFVTEIDGQYVLQYAGHRVIDAIQSGVFHTSPSVGPVEAPGSCPACGSSVLFEYDNHLATVSCGECETKLIEYPFDPGGFQDRSLEDAVLAFDRRTKHKWQLASGGVCFVCAGCVDVCQTDAAVELEQHDRYTNFFAEDHPVLLELTCQNCSFYSYIPISMRVFDNPTLVGELATRGIDIRDTLLWELPFVTDGDYITVENRNPWTVHVEAPTPNGTVTAIVDDTASVQSVTVYPNEIT